MGFLGAGYLIGKSYLDWQESPVATSITVHPISGLDLPAVTVCPQKGLNTALYHDLTKHNDNSLTDKDRENLKMAAYKIFMEEPYKNNAEEMIAITNPENVQEVLQGFQSYPKPYGNHGFEVRMWNTNGSIHTPWYGEEFHDSYYKKDRIYHMVLEIPADLRDQIGSGSLAIDVEVDLRREEVVTYSAGTKFRYHGASKNWANAESHCRAEGGHLASVMTEAEERESFSLAPGPGTRHYWLGGRWKNESWMWTTPR